ncbi:uncharacterized protein LOC123509643 isoform X2 [Portunus trituberculatus]|uniref:uncharacterized protein LOC123509643 isoform X2 n=1 Tax=Portunus trituberculatus TaxID=210409 RepID=UPI001E1CEDDF|nr:uncharacterized protein LOC123509643 isoform X2 [Portunus trituberculatus]
MTLSDPCRMEVEQEDQAQEHPGLLNTANDTSCDGTLPKDRCVNAEVPDRSKGRGSSFATAKTRQTLHRYRNQILRLRKQLQSKLSKTSCTSKNLFKNVTKHLNPKLVSFMASQIKQGKRKANGRRYSKEEKMLALATYYTSPRAYRFLASLFTLPAFGTLHTWLRRIQMNVGWNATTLKFMAQKSTKMKESNKLCGIMFDAVHLQEHITYNMATDTCEGTENLGEFGMRNKAQTMQLYLWYVVSLLNGSNC